MKQTLTELSPLERMIQQQVIDRGIRDERVLAAMRSVPREKFFPEESRHEAYADRAAPIGHGQTISQPYMVALMTQRLDVRPEHNACWNWAPAAGTRPRSWPSWPARFTRSSG